MPRVTYLGPSDVYEGLEKGETGLLPDWAIKQGMERGHDFKIVPEFREVKPEKKSVREVKSNVSRSNSGG